MAGGSPQAAALPALACLGVSAAAEADAGVASGLFNTSQQVGAAVGVALLSTVAATRTSHVFGGHGSVAAALTSGYRLAFAVGAGLCAAPLLVAGAAMQARRAGGDQRESANCLPAARRSAT
jgi:hypothetical protein